MIRTLLKLFLAKKAFNFLSRRMSSSHPR